MGTAIKHHVPDRGKPSFVIFDIRALWRSVLSVRVPLTFVRYAHFVLSWVGSDQICLVINAVVWWNPGFQSSTVCVKLRKWKIRQVQKRSGNVKVELSSLGLHGKCRSGNYDETILANLLNMHQLQYSIRIDASVSLQKADCLACLECWWFVLLNLTYETQ